MGAPHDPSPVLAVPLLLLLLALAAIDLRRRRVPNRLLAPAAGFAVGAGALVDPDHVAGRLVFGALAFMALLALSVLSAEGLGMGDVKLAGVIGLFLGPAVLPALVAAFATGSVWGALILLRHGAPARRRTLPFVPFLALGGLVGLACGDDLLRLYLAGMR